MAELPSGHWGRLHVHHAEPHPHRPGVRADVGHALRFVEGGAPRFELVPAGVPHRCRGEEAAWALGFCARCVDLEDSPLLTPFRRVLRGAQEHVPVAPERAPWIAQLFAELAAECARDGAESEALRRALLQLVLGEVRRAMGAPEGQPAAGLVAQALEFIWAHALGPLSLADVAKHVHRSPKHLATEVKKATGHTVGEWIRATRVESAASWLLHSELGMDEIAARVGWADTTHFIRQFKQVQGCTPAAWRRRVREQP
ncbi:MAG: helix-turn-helix transcriptional regulator [Alphaproteobacteria bacterium]|nr:helix-turn-helix transcriptional regulator [Alphaproteobacteria bacterium]MCB9792387.1 helix-turn-helix transcriptional regulator [Alphaproteobacteria bacterium]